MATCEARRKLIERQLLGKVGKMFFDAVHALTKRSVETPIKQAIDGKPGLRRDTSDPHSGPYVGSLHGCASLMSASPMLVTGCIALSGKRKRIGDHELVPAICKDALILQQW